MEIMATCILSLLSACSYLLPVSFFLPCRLSKKEKGILYLIFLGSILLIQWELGNIGVADSGLRRSRLSAGGADACDS